MAIYIASIFGYVAETMVASGATSERVMDFLVGLSLTDHKDFAPRAGRLLQTAHRIESAASSTDYDARLASVGADATALLKEASRLIEDVIRDARSERRLEREESDFRPGD